jgi:ribosomal subunit interface protein
MRYDIHTHDVTIGSALQKIISQKVSKLDKRIESYHSDAARLELQLRRHEKAQSVRCALTLHAYQDALHAEKDATDLRAAVDRAFDALFKELEHYRARINKSLQPGTRKAGLS